MGNKNSTPLEKLIVVGDRVLIRPKGESGRTRGGLFLPPGYSEKEEIQSGYVVKVGPGYPVPLPGDELEEPWKNKSETVNYFPLQARVGDLAIFLKKSSVEIQYHGEKYYIVSQNSILLLERDDLTIE